MSTDTTSPDQLADVLAPPVGVRRRRTVRLPGGRKEPLPIFAGRVALPVILLLLIATFSVLSPSTFFTVANLSTVLNLQAVLTIVSVGLLLPLIVGELDLSVASNLGLGLILVTGLTSKQHLPLLVAVAVALVVCSLVGLANGLLVARVGINSLIVTLGMSTIIGGVVAAYTQGAVFYEGIPKGLLAIGQGSVLGVPRPVLVAAGVALLGWYLLSNTPLGRYLYATGGSREAARLSGVPVQRYTVGAFVGAGFLAGVAGVVQAGILGSGNPTVGPPLLLPAFAAVFLGATTILPGSFNVWGTVLAVITLQVGTTGLALLGAPFWIEPIFTGVALISAVAASRYLRGEAL